MLSITAQVWFNLGMYSPNVIETIMSFLLLSLTSKNTQTYLSFLRAHFRQVLLIVFLRKKVPRVLWLLLNAGRSRFRRDDWLPNAESHRLDPTRALHYFHRPVNKHCLSIREYVGLSRLQDKWLWQTWRPYLCQKEWQQFWVAVSVPCSKLFQNINDVKVALLVKPGDSGVCLSLDWTDLQTIRVKEISVFQVIL